MTSVRRSLALSFIERYALITISLLSNILLARLLTPKEIGVYSVSLAVIGIAQVLRDFGIGNFLIQEKNLSEAHIRTAFSFSLLLGGGLFFVTYFAAPFAGDFYGEDQMVLTMRISSLNFFVLPFCSISLSLLRRKMAFKRMMIVNLIAAGFGFVASISLAYSGFGPNSMAIGAVVANIVTGIGSWFARTDRKLLLPGFSGWRTLLKFGAQNSVASVVTTISMDINDLVLGKVLGFASVAMISRAQGLMNLFHRDMMSGIQNVAFPAFAKASRDEESLEPYYAYSVSLITLIAWPFYGFISFFAQEILRLMFGPQWDEATSLVPIFCFAGAIAATSNLVLPAILAVGRIDLVTKVELIFQPIRAALIVGAAIIFQSLVACAIAYFVSFVIFTIFVYAIKEICIQNDYRKLCANLWINFKVTVVTLVFPAALWFNSKVISLTLSLPPAKFIFDIGIDRNIPASIVTVIAAATLAVISWFIALIIFRHPITADPLFRRFTSKLTVFS